MFLTNHLNWFETEAIEEKSYSKGFSNSSSKKKDYYYFNIEHTLQHFFFSLEIT